MARSAIAVQQISRPGLINPSNEGANVDGNSFANTGNEVLFIENGATDVVVTVKTPRGIDGQATTNRTVTVPATQNGYLGPFPPGLFNQRGALGDIVHVDYDVITNVSVSVLRF